jgi:hypothetical protein
MQLQAPWMHVQLLIAAHFLLVDPVSISAGPQIFHMPSITITRCMIKGQIVVILGVWV